MTIVGRLLLSGRSDTHKCGLLTRFYSSFRPFCTRVFSFAPNSGLFRIRLFYLIFPARFWFSFTRSTLRQFLLLNFPSTSVTVLLPGFRNVYFHIFPILTKTIAFNLGFLFSSKFWIKFFLLILLFIFDYHPTQESCSLKMPVYGGGNGSIYDQCDQSSKPVNCILRCLTQFPKIKNVSENVLKI